MTFAKAFETAQSMELANEKGLHEVRIPLEDSINKVNCFSGPKCPGKGSGDCFRCGQKHHPSECWWPGMVGAIEDRVSACHVCASVAKSLLKAPLHPRKWPAKPWERVHMVYGQVARKSSRPKSCRPTPESCCSKFIVMLLEIHSHVARNP